jgi:Domain of unknown function (DUF4349)
MHTNRKLIVVAALLAIAGCSKQESADQAAAYDSAAGASAPNSVAENRSAEAEKAVAPQAARMEAPLQAEPSAMADAAVVSEDKAGTQIETDTRPTAADVSSSATTYEDGKRKFIRSAQAQFRVKDVYRSALAIEDVAAAQGGFVVNNNIYAQANQTQRRPAGHGMLIELTEYTVRGDITVRVPSDNTQAFLRAIANQMEFLEQRSFTAADAQFQILRQQLAFQREQDAQRQIGQAAQQGGRIIDKVDAISAQSGAKLQRDEALIQQKEFEDKVEFSTISLSLAQLSKIRKTELPDVEAIFRDNSPGFLARLGDSLSIGWYAVLDVFVALMRAWPVWLLLIAAFVGFRRWRANRRPPPLPKASE